MFFPAGVVVRKNIDEHQVAISTKVSAKIQSAEFKIPIYQIWQNFRRSR